MSLYLRKYFSSGPIRLNLSKSGLGLSGGIKGARIGVGPKGTYVHAGRQGLYYRKHLSSGQRTQGQSTAAGKGSGKTILIIIGVVIGFIFLKSLLKSPANFVTGHSVAIGITIIWWVIRFRRKNNMAAYKQSLDSAFVTAQSTPSDDMLTSLKQQQQTLPKANKNKQTIDKIEADVYQAILDKVLDDGYISKEETEIIAAAEHTLRISAAARLMIKKEIFSAAYVEAIQDRKITDDEFSKLNNLIEGLAIPQTEVQQELNIVKEIIASQTLSLPFDPIPPDKLLAPISKNEVAFYQSSAQVLSKKKSKKSPTGYEYTVRRNGTMVVTNKRIFVMENGTTTIRFSDIDDLDVDIDEGVIEISKIGSGRPIILKVDAPIYTGRTIDLLTKAATGSNAA